MILAEQAWEKENTRLEKELKDVREQIINVNKEFQETQHRLASEALGGRTDPKKNTKQLVNELKGEAKKNYDTRLREAQQRRNAELKPLYEEEGPLKKKQRELGPPRVAPARNQFREYLPLLLPLFSGFVVYGLARLFGLRDEPALMVPAPKAVPTALPPKNLGAADHSADCSGCWTGTGP